MAATAGVPAVGTAPLAAGAGETPPTGEGVAAGDCPGVPEEPVWGAAAWEPPVTGCPLSDGMIFASLTPEPEGTGLLRGGLFC